MRNEMTASKLCSAKRLRQHSRSHRLLAGDVIEVLLPCGNHGCDEERSRATSLEDMRVIARQHTRSLNGEILTALRDYVTRQKPPEQKGEGKG